MNNEIFLIFSYKEEAFNYYSLICYDIKLEQINTKIAKAHENRIYTCRYFYDQINKNDLIITGSFDRWIKIWNITNNFNLLFKKKPDYDYKTNTYLLSEYLLFYNHKNYLITSAYEINSFGYEILFYDYKEKPSEIQKIKDSQVNTNY